jgi:hypothetical protein
MPPVIVRALSVAASRPLYPLACAVMLLVLTGINFYVVAVLSRQSDWVYHTGEVLIEVNNLEHYANVNNLDKATESYAALRRLTADNPVQQHNLDQFDSQLTCSHDRTVQIMPAITHAMFDEETRLRRERVASARRTTSVLSLC